MEDNGVVSENEERSNPPPPPPKKVEQEKLEKRGDPDLKKSGDHERGGN